MILGTNPVITFGTLNMFGSNTRDGIPFSLYIEGDELDWGNPQPIETTLSTLLENGSLSVTESYDNREVPFRVTVSAVTYEGMLAGESALFEAIGKPSLLKWTPPRAGTPPTTVFVVVNSHLERVFDDLDDRRFTTSYGIVATCEPFTRSLNPVTVTATPTGVVTPVVTLIDECTSLTNYTGSHTRSVVSGQAVRVTKDPGDGDETTFWIQRTASVTLTQPYVRAKFGGNLEFSRVWLTMGGVDYDPITSGGGYYWFAVPAGTYASIRISAIKPAVFGRPSTAPQYAQVWSLYQTNVNSFGTRKELLQTFDIGGVAPTPGELTISHATVGLGDVMVYSYPPELAVYTPGLAPYRTGGGAQTPDGTAVSGTNELLSANPVYSVPVDELPRGTYNLVARLMNTVAGWADLTYIATIGGQEVQGTVRYNFVAANTWYIVPIDWLTLPSLRYKGTATTPVVLDMDSTVTTVKLDMAWLFHTEGDLTIVSAGSELSVEILSPTTDEPGGVAWIGDHYPGTALAALGRHMFRPKTTSIYVVSTGTNDAVASLTSYNRWFGRAGS